MGNQCGLNYNKVLAGEKEHPPYYRTRKIRASSGIKKERERVIDG